MRQYIVSYIARAGILLLILQASLSATTGDEQVAVTKTLPPTQFSYTDASAKSVFLAAEFNHWNTAATPMRSDGNGTWTVEVVLRPGKYNYKFYVDGRWLQDPANADEGPDGRGGMNSIVTVADPSVDPVVMDRDAIQRKAAQLFSKSDFTQLESMADELRTKRSRFSDGQWKLMEFYNGLQAEKRMESHKDWKPWFDKLDAWGKAFPDSITQPVVLARGWVDYAWDARGTGYSNTVSEEGWKLHRERLVKARAVLESAAKLPARCPNWWGVMQVIALGQGWPLKEYVKGFSAAASAEPTYYEYYFGMAYFLLPRWYGSSGDWERSAEEAASRFDSKEGLSAYTRTAWYLSEFYNNLFQETAIHWPRMKQGFLDIEKGYPNSRWNLNAFCRFAVMAGDRKTANELFARIGNHGDPNWGTYGRYEMAKAWASPSTPDWRLKPRRVLTTEGKAPVNTIAFSPDGKLLAAGDEGGSVTIWNPADGKQIWRTSVADDPVSAVVFSPDGKLMAAGAGERYQRTTHLGVVKIWDASTKTEQASFAPHRGSVWSIAFAPNNQFLAVVGGEFNERGAAAIYDLREKKLDEEMPWSSRFDHGVHSVGISPDSRLLATDSYQSINVWSIDEKKALFDAANTLKNFTEAVAFSPDGKFLAAVGRPSYGHHNDEPGGLVLWDTETWKQRTPREQVEAGGLLCVAFSPDGKQIAAGGYDECIHVWSTATLQQEAAYLANDGVLWSVSFSPDGKTVASGSKGGVIKIWSLRQ